MKSKLALSAIMLLCSLWSLHLMAGIEVEININLPLVEIKEEPVMAVIPSTNIYFIDAYDQDYFFYGGYWWRVHNNRWYRARHYNGKWKYRKNKHVPEAFHKLSPQWRKMTKVHSGIKYSDMKKNWKRWDKEKHWEKQHDQKEIKNEKQNKNKKSGKNRN